MVAVDAKRYPANALPVSVSTKAGGVVLAVSSGIFGTTDIIWSGMVENYQQVIGAAVNSCASLHATTTGTASVNITLASSGGNAPYNLVSLR